MINEMSILVQDLLQKEKVDKSKYQLRQSEGVQQKLVQEDQKSIDVEKEPVFLQEQSDQHEEIKIDSTEQIIDDIEPKIKSIEPTPEIVLKEESKAVSIEPKPTEVNLEESKALGIQMAKQYEFEYLKEHIEDLYKDVVQKEVKCSACNLQNFKGIRYLCTICEDFNLCSKCEDFIDHMHPMLKFKAPADFEKYKNDLLLKFPEILEIEQNKEKLKKEEQDEAKIREEGSPIRAKSPAALHKPKVIDAISKISDPIYDSYIDFQDLDKNDVYSDELLKSCKSRMVKMTPGMNHVISIYSSDICVTVCLRNTGTIAWPRGFKVKLMGLKKEAIKTTKNYVVIEPDDEIMLDIFIKNPKEVGSYYYVFTLVDVNGRSFGDQFLYTFEVKKSSYMFGGVGGFGGYGGHGSYGKYANRPSQNNQDFFNDYNGYSPADAVYRPSFENKPQQRYQKSVFNEDNFDFNQHEEE